MFNTNVDLCKVSSNRTLSFVSFVDLLAISEQFECVIIWQKKKIYMNDEEHQRIFDL